MTKLTAGGLPAHCLTHHIHTYLFMYLVINRNRDSSDGIANCYGTGGLGDRIPVGVRFSAPVQTGSEAHPASYTMGTESVRG